MPKALRVIFTLLNCSLFAASVEAGFFDSVKKGIEDVANTAEELVDQTQESIESIQTPYNPDSQQNPESKKSTNEASPKEEAATRSPSGNGSTSEEWRTHKDEFFDHCMGKRDSKPYCQCLMPAVEATVAKRKARMEKMISHDTDRLNKQYKASMSLVLRKRVAKDESEVLADCDVMKAHRDKKISDDKFNKTFSGKKGGFYKDKLEKHICFSESAEKSKTQVLYENKDYEYVNAASIMTGDNQCSRQHLK